MVLSRETPCNVIEIKTPVWGGRKIGIATYKIGTHNEVRILARDKDGMPLYPQPFYISGEKAQTYQIQPVKRNPNILLYIIPINDLEVLERG